MPTVADLTGLLSRGWRPAGDRPGLEPWTVVSVPTLEAARHALSERLFDLEIIDRTLPDGDGLDFVDWQRKAGVRTPIVVLTKLSDLTSRLQGYSRLADHYVGKPYDVDELLAVLHAATWRNRADGLLVCGKLEIGFQGLGFASFAGKELISVRSKELRVLALLAAKDPVVVTRTMLHEEVWDLRAGFIPEGGDRIATTISRLKKNLRQDGVQDEIIVTVPGVGWVLDRACLQGGA